MKTSTNEVGCDACNAVVPMLLSGSPALSVKIKGQSVGMKMLDFCNSECMARWAMLAAAIGRPNTDSTKSFGALEKAP